tara:strand:+ start:233 stop:436 length:204 start_codon:yes stop_codon:yes gene_type:complete
MILSIGPAQFITLLIVALILNVFIARIIAKSASHKKISYWTVFFICLFFTPLIGLLLVIASPEKDKE